MRNTIQNRAEDIKGKQNIVTRILNTVTSGHCYLLAHFFHFNILSLFGRNTHNRNILKKIRLCKNYRIKMKNPWNRKKKIVPLSLKNYIMILKKKKTHLHTCVLEYNRICIKKHKIQEFFYIQNNTIAISYAIKKKKKGD